MRKSRFTDSQIIAVLKRADVGTPVTDLCRELGVSSTPGFLHIRNVKGIGWNQKRVYRIYRDLELSLRIKPKKRLVREVPQCFQQATRGQQKL